MKRIVLAAASLMVVGSAAVTRAEFVDFRLEGRPASYGWGVTAKAILRYRAACAMFTSPAPLESYFEPFVDGIPGRIYFWGFYDSCADDVHTRVGNIYSQQQFLDLGPHMVSVRYRGLPGHEPAQADLVVDVVPTFSGAASSGAGTVSLGVRDAASICQTDRHFDFAAMPVVSAAQAPKFPHGVINFRMTCYADCGGFAAGCLQPPIFVPGQRMQVEYPFDLPPGSSIWAYVTTDRNPFATWQQVPARIDGPRATFLLTGPPMALVQAFPHKLAGSIGVSIPTEHLTRLPQLQDMWWGGPGEEGWGVSIAQDGSRLFVTLHAYDDQGQPAFYLLHNGTWDAEGKAFGGALHRPTAGTMGAPVGTLHLLLSDPDKPLLKYVLPSGEGLRSIQRMAFGPAPAQADSQSGIWDLTLAGTGAVTINKHGESLFITWLEFPGAGAGQWMVAPAGQWTSADTYEATLYRTTASRWAGAPYDASRLRAQAVGSIKVRFISTVDAEVTYTIDGVTQASPLRRHAF